MMQLPQGGRARKEFWKKGLGIEASRTVLRYVPSAPIAFSEESNKRYAEKEGFLASIRAEIAPQLKQIQERDLRDLGWERKGRDGDTKLAESPPSFVSVSSALSQTDPNSEGGDF